MENKVDLKEFFGNYLGFIVIGFVFVISTVIVVMHNPVSLVKAGTIAVKVQQGDTLESLAEKYQTSVENILAVNSPALDPKLELKPGKTINIPRNVRNRIITISIAHWQLEPGVRDALNVLSKEYTKLHPNIHIMQNAIPESTYQQWFVTQMIGGNRPDLIEIGFVPWNLIVGYFSRYFTPLTKVFNKPNPYNAHNEFAKTPFKYTAKDNYIRCYVGELQEYMSAGLSLFIVRFYYNKTLYKRFTGKDDPPKNWREFVRVCEQIRVNRFLPRKTQERVSFLEKRIKNSEQNIVKLEKGGKLTSGLVEKLKQNILTDKTEIESLMKNCPRYIPIANSAYHINTVDYNLFQALTTKLQSKLDFNRDCWVDTYDMYKGIVSQKVALTNEAYEAMLTLISNYCAYSPPGFSGLGRDDAVLMFVQQRAVFIPTGTWDAQTLEAQAHDNGFDIGVMDFPLPDKDDPQFGKFMDGPLYENPNSGFSFGVATSASDPERRDAAIDFLLFLASKENDIRLNNMIGWIPAVRNSEIQGILKNFEPHYHGLASGISQLINGDSTVKWQQLISLFYVNQIDRKKLMQDFQPVYLQTGYRDYTNSIKPWRWTLVNEEKNLNNFRVKSMLASSPEQRDAFDKKYKYEMLRPVFYEADKVYEIQQMKIAHDTPQDLPDAYYYSPEARRRLGMQ